MEPAASSNNKGFTLIEVLVSIIILTVGLLALLQTVNVCIAHNLTNQLRNEAIVLADETMNTIKMTPYDSITVPSNVTTTVDRTINLGTKSFSVTTITTQPTDLTIHIEIVVTWQHKGQTYTYPVVSLLTKNQ